ncbi:MAG: hypothetical protein KC419_05995 [Anaerolineales bacterium]|nr:hypothetical protein [Anaerolineales bacterium]MCA9928005.1 hypothetical protein [Anaerolineales bacterium]
MDSIFGIGFPELFTILILAGIVMGPERIGRVARWLGKVTAQLQIISRGFVRQLTMELESIDDGGEMKNAMKDIQELQKQLAELRGEFRGQAKGFITESKTAVQEIEQSIKPPTLGKLISGEEKSTEGDDPTTNNGSSADNKSAEIPPLPKLVDVPDDPES